MLIREMKLGDSASVTKTVTETDVYLFAGITGDLSPAHTNEVSASQTQFGGRIAHGILGAGFISAVLGRGLVNTMIAIGIVNIPVFARTVRAPVISAKGLEYVQNAKSVGVRTGAILIRHISPNVVAPFTVQATLALSSAILTEASMSFLGLGIQPPDPSWGSMLSEARTFMEQAPWMAVFPALFIIVTILLFNILGDSLRDVLDPKLKL